MPGNLGMYAGKELNRSYSKQSGTLLFPLFPERERKKIGHGAGCCVSYLYRLHSESKTAHQEAVPFFER